MDRKKIKEIQTDQVNTMLNAQELSNMMLELEAKTIELAETLDKTKNKRKRAKLEAELNTLLRVVETIGSGNVSLLSH